MLMPYIRFPRVNIPMSMRLTHIFPADRCLLGTMQEMPLLCLLTPCQLPLRNILSPEGQSPQKPCLAPQLAVSARLLDLQLVLPQPFPPSVLPVYWLALLVMDSWMVKASLLEQSLLETPVLLMAQQYFAL